MYFKLNLQYVISYLGLFPFIFILLNKYYFFLINEEISHNFIIYYCNIIIVFIGAINWDLDKKINNLKAIYGFIPSLFALTITILNLYNYNINNLIIIIMLFYFLQLFCDYFFLYKYKTNKSSFTYLRMPLTIFIIISIFLIK